MKIMKIYHYTTIKQIKNEINDTTKEIVLDSIFCDIIYKNNKELFEIKEQLKIENGCDIIEVAIHENENFKIK